MTSLTAVAVLLLPLATGLLVGPAVHPARRGALGPRRLRSPLMGAWSHSDERSLHQQIAQCNSATRLGAPGEVLRGMEAAYVLIFNEGHFDEGVYTLQGQAATAYVLAFEVGDEALRFAQLLQAEGFDLASTCRWEQDQLASFCDLGAFELSLVPTGTLITPPAKNEYDLDAFDRLGQAGWGMEWGGEAGAGADADADRERLERLFRQS